jgi:predicted nucleic acid-binding Zn ribbon protein
MKIIKNGISEIRYRCGVCGCVFEVGVSEFTADLLLKCPACHCAFLEQVKIEETPWRGGGEG